MGGENSIPSAGKFMALAIKYIVKMTLVYHFHLCSELYNSQRLVDDFFSLVVDDEIAFAIFHWSIMSFCVYVKRTRDFTILPKQIAME